MSTQARHADVRAQVVGRREEVGVRAHRDLDRARAAQVRVVVVVPRRHRVDHRVARIEHGAVRTVEQRPRAARDQHRLDRVRQPEVLRVEARDRLAQRRARRPTAGSSSARRRARRACPSSSSAGAGNCAGSKSPTVRLQISAPFAFRARISAAMRRISEPITPRARSPSDASTRAGSPSLPLRSIEPLSYNRSPLAAREPRQRRHARAPLLDRAQPPNARMVAADRRGTSSALSQRMRSFAYWSSCCV